MQTDDSSRLASPLNEGLWRTLLARVDALEKRVAELDADAKAAPAYANPRRYYRDTSGGATTDGRGPEAPCTACRGERVVPDIGEYETTYFVGGKLMRKCPACMGAGVTRTMLTADELHRLSTTRRPQDDEAFSCDDQDAP